MLRAKAIFYEGIFIKTINIFDQGVKKNKLFSKYACHRICLNIAKRVYAFYRFPNSSIYYNDGTVFKRKNLILTSLNTINII